MHIFRRHREKTVQQSLAWHRGTSLLDVLVGVSLFLLVFLSIFGSFKLAIEIVVSTKAKTGSLALANEQMEFIRSLEYSDVGTVGGIPAGTIEQEESILLNNTDYTRRTFIQFVDDDADGLGVNDENGITADYKVVKVEMIWSVRGNERRLALVTNIVPRGIETIAGGGTLIINVIDGLGIPVSGATVRIVNSGAVPAIDVNTITNVGGRVVFPGSPAAASYEITVTRSGYSSAQTYQATAGNPNPNPGHLTVLEGQTTSITFAVDIVAQKTVQSWEPVEVEQFEDVFDNSASVGTSTNVTILGGAVELANAGGYISEGEIHSIPIEPTYLTSWGSFSFVDQTPLGTEIAYSLYYEDILGADLLVPDIVFPGNSAGFTDSPIDVSGISVVSYPSLVLGATLTTTDDLVTPTLSSWLLTYQNGPEPIPNVPFSMRGTKIIGTDGGGLPIYKYNENHSTDGTGTVVISNLEWDTYVVEIDDGATGYDIAESCEPQPLAVAPGAVATTDLTLLPDTPHSLLVIVRDNASVLMEGASVHPTYTGYDQTQLTSSCGQTFFANIPPTAPNETYTLVVSAAGYQEETLATISISGAVQVVVTLNPL